MALLSLSLSLSSSLSLSPDMQFKRQEGSRHEKRGTREKKEAIKCLPAFLLVALKTDDLWFSFSFRRTHLSSCVCVCVFCCDTCEWCYSSQSFLHFDDLACKWRHTPYLAKLLAKITLVSTMILLSSSNILWCDVLRGPAPPPVITWAPFNLEQKTSSLITPRCVFFHRWNKVKTKMLFCQSLFDR